jgi:CheY-like chemotaxis protein
MASSPGKNQGATFTLELPEALLAPAARSAEPSTALNSETGPDNGSLRILLVEDNADTLRVMARLLTRKGHQVTAADGVIAALQAAQRGEFDLVISDLGLPDGNGLDLIRQLHASVAKPIPGIALSGFGMDEDVRRSRDAGFAEHLIKPIDFPSLDQAIRRVTLRIQEPGEA